MHSPLKGKRVRTKQFFFLLSVDATKDALEMFIQTTSEIGHCMGKLSLAHTAQFVRNSI